MKNGSKIVLGIIGFAIIAGIGIWGLSQKPATIANNVNISNANVSINANAADQIQTTVQLDRGDQTAVKLFTVKGEKDQTALAQLQKAAADNNIAIEIKTSDFGSYVDSLDGLKGGTDGKYWMYSVNGKSAEVGADQYKLKEGDAVEWKFTK